MKKQNQKLKEDLEKKIDEHHCSCCPNHNKNNKKESKA